MTVKDCVTPFIVGGLLVGITVILAKYMSPRAAAYFYAYPLGFIVSIIFLMQHQQRLAEFSKDVILAGFCAFLFILVFGLIYNCSNNDIWMSLIYSSFLWVILTILTFKMTDYFRGIN